MKKALLGLILLPLFSGASAFAVVGGQEIGLEDPLARSTVFMSMCHTKNVCLHFDDKDVCHPVTDCMMCSGFVAEKNYIVTAAHCLQGYEAKELELVFSSNANATYKNKEREKIFKVADFRLHPKFKNEVSTDKKNGRKAEVNGKNRYDVAVVKVAGEMPESYQPVELASTLDGMEDGQSTTVAGYGASRRESKKGIIEGIGVLRKADLPIGYLNYSRLEAKIDMNSKTGICAGDSGGPLFVNQGGRPVVWAVNSINIAKNPPFDDCDYRSEVTKIPPVRDWILEQIHSM